jgi:tetratricopeptide (TPR) repeat protein
MGKANQRLKMSKYAFLRSNASLVIIGSLLGLMGGFKIANLQYRSEQSRAKNREILDAADRMPGSQAQINEIIEKARANPNDVKAQVDAASVFIQVERAQEAMPFLEQARKVDPNNSRISAGLGVAHYMLRQYDQAIEWVKRSRDQGGSFPGMTEMLIELYIRTGKNLDEADRMLKEIEAKDGAADSLARLRQELNAARSGKTENPGATPQPQTMLRHGPEEPKRVK